MNTVTRETPIMEAVRSSKEALRLFARFGLSGCAMCHMREEESIGQGGDAHGIDTDGLIAALNEAAKKENAAG